MRLMDLLRNLEPVDCTIPQIAVNIAYVKPVDEEGLTYYKVCGVDGRTLAIAPTRELAFALTRQNDFEPCDAH